MVKKNVLKGKEVKKKEKEVKEKKVTSLTNIIDRVDKRKAKSITGALLILSSIYLFIAFFSYLFSWKADQDLIVSNSFWNYIFGDATIEAKNWLGKFGAWVSHLFMYKWFGIVSFTFSFLAFVIGVFLLLNIKLLPLRKTFLISFLAIVWISVFLGLVSSDISYLGGAFGFISQQWLSSIFGTLGTALLLFAVLFVAIVTLFNPDFKSIYNKYFKKEKRNIEDIVEPENTYTEELTSQFITEDEDSLDLEEEVDLNQEYDEQDYEEDDEDFEVITKTPEATNINTDTEDLSSSVEEFEVEVAQTEKELSGDEVNSILKVAGPYDPKLELSEYKLPELDLLKKYDSNDNGVTKEELEQNKDNIVQTLANYKIEIAKIKATIGPTVTLYEIVPAPGVRISKIKNLEDDIALSLAALGIRIIAPIPGKGTIGIEVPNSNPQVVSMRSLIASEKYQNTKAELPVVLGKTITNETYTFDLTKMPHLLVAGATGQGKSVGLNAILVSLLYKKHPSEVKFVLVDPKKVELTLYNKIERHFLAKLPGEEDAIITDTSKVVNTLNSLCIEMDERYDLLKDAMVRNIKEYNEKFIKRQLNPEKGHKYMPYIVVLIDEFADLIMTAGKEVEHPIARLAQLARAIGIHLIVATQRPSVNVITGMIKANFPARIAFRVLSKIDSRTILDSSGADQLIGKGDMLISTGSEMVRLQCGFVDTPEVEGICDFIGEQRGYTTAFELPEYEGELGEGGNIDVDDDLDPKFEEAAFVLVENQQGSTSLIQRKLKLGYNRAGRIIDQLEYHGIVGKFQGSKARDVLIPTIEALNEKLSEMKAQGLL